VHPASWAWVALVVSVCGIAPALPRRLGPVLGITRAIAAASLAALVLAAVGGVVVDGWWPAGAVAAWLGALLVVLAAAGTAARTATGFGDHIAPLLVRFASVTDNAVAAGALAGLAAVHLVTVEWVGVAQPTSTLAAFGAGIAIAFAVLVTFDLGRAAELPRRGAVGALLAPVVLATIAAIVVADTAATTAWSSVPLAVLTVGVAATIAATLIHRGDPVAVVRRRGYLVSGIVGAGGFVLAWIERPAGAGWEAVGGVGAAVAVGAALAVALGMVGHVFTSDHWRPGKRIAARSRSGAATVITTGLGDAARAGAVVIGVLAVGMFLAHRAGEYAGVGGGYGMTLAVVGLVAVLAVPASGMRFAVLGRGVPIADDATDASRESVASLVAAGSAARAVGAVVVTSAGALTALSLVVALWEVSAVEIIGGGIGMVIGVAAGMVAIWYAAGWALHVTPQPGSATRGSAHRPPSTWAAIGALVVPVVVAVLVPVGLGHARAAALGGYLVGLLAAGPALAVVVVVAGGAWENVRRLIETGAYGGVGSRAHRAVVAADAVGESLRSSMVTAVVALLVTTAAVALAFAGSF